MKITCLRENLRSGLGVVEKVAGKNLTLPILQNVLLTAAAGKIRLSATNLEIAIHTTVSGKIEEEGLVTIPAHTFSNFISAVPEEKINLKQQDHHLLIHAGRYRAQCRGLDPKDFPIIPKITEEFSVNLEGKVFGKILQTLVGLTATGETKPELSGVCFIFEEKKAVIAATDSFRLGEFTIPLENQSIKKTHEYIIPTRTVAELIRIIGNDDTCTFVAGGNQVAIRVGEKELISRLIESKYPNYKAIVPTSFTTNMVFEREELVQAVRAAGIFSGKLQDVKLSFKPEKKLLVLESRDSEVGEEKIELPGEGEGKEITISFNYRYLLDAILGTNSSRVSLQCNKETDPALLRGVGEDTSFFLIMPLRSF